MAKARKFGLGGTIKKTVEKTVEAAKNTPKKAVEVTRGAVDKKDTKSMLRESPPVPSPKTPVKGVATSFKGNDTPTKPLLKGIDTPVPAAKTSVTGPSKGIISKVAELKDIKTPQIRPATPTVSAAKTSVTKDIKTPQIRPATPTVSAVQSERLNAVKDMARPVTPKPSAPAVAPQVSAPASPTSPLGRKPAALAAFNPKGMKKGGATKSYKAGGTVSGASKRGDGIAIRGKTRGKIC